MHDPANGYNDTMVWIPEQIQICTGKLYICVLLGLDLNLSLTQHNTKDVKNSTYFFIADVRQK